MIKVFRQEPSIFYLLNYSNDHCLAVDFGGGEKLLITDARYSEAAKLIGGFEVIESRNLISALISALKQRGVKKALFDSTEWSADEFFILQKSSIFWYKKSGFARKLRAIKREDEIAKISFACQYGRNAFNELLKYLTVDASEKRVAFEMTNLMNKNGEHDISFTPIVAFGANASVPHYVPNNVLLKKNDSLLVDAGCKIDNYCSDMTRTAFFEQNTNFEYKQKFPNSLHQKIYNTVLHAHDEAIKCAKVGMQACELDKIARDIIAKAGFEKEFKHGLGHGVGLEIHEEPSISMRSNTVLEEGMVFTIEPGIYIENEFGVRIEDVVVLTSSGAQVLGA